VDTERNVIWFSEIFSNRIGRFDPTQNSFVEFPVWSKNQNHGGDSKISVGVRNKKWARLLAYVTGSVNQELLLQNEYLAAENRILRAKLRSKLRLTDPERVTLAEIGKRLGRKALREVASVAKPEQLPITRHNRTSNCQLFRLDFRVKSTPVICGLHHEYSLERRAAG
jgi:hypothetical protein